MSTETNNAVAVAENDIQSLSPKGSVRALDVLRCSAKRQMLFVDCVKAFSYATHREKVNGDEGSLQVRILAERFDSPLGKIAVHGTLTEVNISDKAVERNAKRDKANRLKALRAEAEKAVAEKNIDKASAILAELKAIEEAPLIPTGTAHFASAFEISLADGFKNLGKEASYPVFLINGIPVRLRLTIDGPALKLSPERKNQAEKRKENKLQEKNLEQLAKGDAEQIQRLAYDLQIEQIKAKLEADAQAMLTKGKNGKS